MLGTECLVGLGGQLEGAVCCEKGFLRPYLIFSVLLHAQGDETQSQGCEDHGPQSQTSLRGHLRRQLNQSAR